MKRIRWFRKAYGFWWSNVIKDFETVMDNTSPAKKTQAANDFINGLSVNWTFQNINNEECKVPKQTWDKVMAHIKAKCPDAITRPWIESNAAKPSSRPNPPPNAL